MSNSKYQSSEFTFVGQVLGCILSKKARIKYLKISLSQQQEYWIKLPKKISSSPIQEMTLGCWLLIKGQKQWCSKTGSILLTADTISPVNFFHRLSYPNVDPHIADGLEEGLRNHFRLRGNFRTIAASL
jgi:hypothetical protein